ncbi:MAG TPA: glycerate kinase [Spirochaetota bacterium]|nr:glycerate kinase [Spirochaetota bacterium]
MEGLRDDIREVYSAAIEAVNPRGAVLEHLRLQAGKLLVRSRGSTIREFDLDAFGRIFVLGAGKATALMARAVEELLGDRISAGLISVKYGYTTSLARIETIEAAHPVPDEKGRRAAERILDMATGAGAGDLIISLISGGGSALLPLPAPPVTLEEKRQTTNLLLKSGASIHEMNAVRKHLSLIKGGNLARAARPATVINLMISDVVGDDPDVIASGPIVPDASTFAEALSILERYGIADSVPASVLDRLRDGVKGLLPENPKVGEECFSGGTGIVIASNILALEAARSRAKSLGYTPVVLSSLIEGDTREAAMFHAAIAREMVASGNPVSAPACLISGGETTVEVRGKGLGGRNMEFALQSAILLDGTRGICVASVGTDGTDGPTDAAGAFADGRTVRRAMAIGLDAGKYASENDSYHFFERLGDLIVTGPTNTNVMDVRIIMVREKGSAQDI